MWFHVFYAENNVGINKVENMKHNFDNDRFGEALRNGLLAKKMSYRDMGQVMKCSHSHIHSLITGRAIPRITDFLYLCDVLELAPSDYFFDTYNRTGLPF